MGTVSVKTPDVASVRLNRILTSAIWVLCLFLFAISAYVKIIEHDRFLKGLEKVRFIGDYAVQIAYIVPASEILVCILLSIPETVRLGFYGFTGLMLLFTGYITGMLLWAQKLPCHCNLIIEKLSFGQHLIFNLAFIALAILRLLMKTNSSKP